MARESEPEPINIVQLLTDLHREIRSLFEEMADIIDIPTAQFELYPRIRVALYAHALGEKLSLYSLLKAIPEMNALIEEAER